MSDEPAAKQSKMAGALDQLKQYTTVVADTGDFEGKYKDLGIELIHTTIIQFLVLVVKCSNSINYSTVHFKKTNLVLSTKLVFLKCF